MCENVQCFNLVIENLIFSSNSMSRRAVLVKPCFNLVIENLIFSSVHVKIDTEKVLETFQSRNRESYLFKRTAPVPKHHKLGGFNLVIENLIFSSKTAKPAHAWLTAFQSRNRESYLFKPTSSLPNASGSSCFNLVIENLIFSS